MRGWCRLVFGCRLWGRSTIAVSVRADQGFPGFRDSQDQKNSERPSSRLTLHGEDPTGGSAAALVPASGLQTRLAQSHDPTCAPPAPDYSL